MKIMDVYFENESGRTDRLQILNNTMYYNPKDYKIYRHVSEKNLQEYGAKKAMSEDCILEIIARGYGRIIKIEKYEIQF